MNTIGCLLRLSSKTEPGRARPGGTRWDQVGPGGAGQGEEGVGGLFSRLPSARQVRVALRRAEQGSLNEVLAMWAGLPDRK